MNHTAGVSLIDIVPLILLLVGLVALVTYSLRTGFSGTGAEVIVRCTRGHFFSTIWIPGISLKSVRLGFARYQRCPIGNHLAFVTPVNPESLTPEQRRLAYELKDTDIP